MPHTTETGLSPIGIGFQGVLKGSEGKQLPDGTYDLRFGFYGSLSGPDLIGVTNVAGVRLTGGLASTTIPVNSEWFSGTIRYLGIAVIGGDPITDFEPRIPITTVPYAIRSAKAQEAETSLHSKSVDWTGIKGLPSAFVTGSAFIIEAAGVGFRPTESQGRRSVEGRLRDTISVLDYIPPEYHQAILENRPLTAGNVDVTRWFQEALDVMPGGDQNITLLVPDGRYYISNLKISGATKVVGQSVASCGLWAVPGTKGKMISDKGNAAKIDIWNLQLYGGFEPGITHGIDLGNGTTPWGTYASLGNLHVRDMTNAVGISLKANIATAYNIATGQTRDGIIHEPGGVGLFAFGAQAGDFRGVGIQTQEGDAWFGIELEAPWPGAIPLAVKRDGIVSGILLAAGGFPGTEFSHLVDIDAEAGRWQLSGIRIIAPGVTYRDVVRWGGKPVKGDLTWMSSVVNLGPAALFMSPHDNKVGIGTGSPTEALDVNGNIAYSGKLAHLTVAPGFTARVPAANFQFGHPNFRGDMGLAIADFGQALAINSSADWPALSLGGNVGIGTTQPTSKLQVVGSTTTSELAATAGSDVAVYLTVVDTKSADEFRVQPGMVVSIDPTANQRLKLSEEPYDRRRFGIISGGNGAKTAIALGASILPEASSRMPISMSGMVWCYADATYGPILPGDLLTTSETPGHAMKATDDARARFAVLGQALSGLEAGRGWVQMMIGRQ